jgi:hypothetical protein
VEAFVCIFCGRAGHLDVFYFYRKRIESRRFEYARKSYHDEFFEFPPSSYSHALPHTSSRALPCFSHGPNHRLDVLVHERIALCIDALVTAHVLIVVIIHYVGPVFLLEVLTLTLSLDTWTAHVFPIVVHIPLGQMVKCKEL